MADKSLPNLYYVHDPMCSWCWGFNPVWQQVQCSLSEVVNIHYVLGGLAADCDVPMAKNMQTTISQTWQRIQKEIPSTKFNYDFWTECIARRSTYPACRAVIAAGMQNNSSSNQMLKSIQQAYYLESRNPSDNDVLIQLASEIGLNKKQFRDDLLSERCNSLFEQELQLAGKLDVNSFPSLVLRYNETNTVIKIDYNHSEIIVSNILAIIK